MSISKIVNLIKEDFTLAKNIKKNKDKYFVIKVYKKIKDIY